MKFSVKRKDIAGQSIEIERSLISGSVKVIVDGKQLERIKEKHGPFEIAMKDKTRRKLFVRARWLDPIPTVTLDQEEILLAERLRFIDYLFGCFPICMFLLYGPLPTLIGFFMLMGNFRILRTKMQPTVKWAAIYGLDLVVFWLVAAIVNFAVTTTGK